jgi:hypothetical protein
MEKENLYIIHLKQKAMQVVLVAAADIHKQNTSTAIHL